MLIVVANNLLSTLLFFLCDYPCRPDLFSSRYYYRYSKVDAAKLKAFLAVMYLWCIILKIVAHHFSYRFTQQLVQSLDLPETAFKLNK